MDKQKVTAFAPATVANVSCGFDILGFAIEDLGDKVSVSLSDKPGVRVVKIEGDNGKLPYESDKNTCSVAVKAMVDNLGFEGGLEIELYKGLPLGSGMGSSAASAVAALVATNTLLGNPYEKRTYCRLVLSLKGLLVGQDMQTIFRLLYWAGLY